MVMEIITTVPEHEQKKLNARLEKVASQVGVEARDVYMDQLRLLMQDFMSRKMPLPESAPQGRKAIDRDLNKLFVSIEQQAVLDFFEDEFGSGSGAGIPGAVAGTIFNFDGNEARMRGWWKKHRQKTGRKAGRVRYFGRIVATVGDIKFANKMYVPKRAFQRFRKDLHKDVATLKAGWVIAGQRLAAAVNTGIRIPAWVMKQAKKMGRVSISTMKKDGNGYISATNSVPYAEEKYARTGLMNPFLAKRRRDIMNALALRVPRLVKQFNTGK